MVAPGAMRRPREDQARLVNAPDASGSRGDNRSFSSSGLERARLADFCSAPLFPPRKRRRAGAANRRGEGISRANAGRHGLSIVPQGLPVAQQHDPPDARRLRGAVRGGAPRHFRAGEAKVGGRGAPAAPPPPPLAPGSDAPSYVHHVVADEPWCANPPRRSAETPPRPAGSRENTSQMRPVASRPSPAKTVTHTKTGMRYLLIRPPRFPPPRSHRFLYALAGAGAYVATCAAVGACDGATQPAAVDAADAAFAPTPLVAASLVAQTAPPSPSSSTPAGTSFPRRTSPAPRRARGVADPRQLERGQVVGDRAVSLQASSAAAATAAARGAFETTTAAALGRVASTTRRTTTTVIGTMTIGRGRRRGRVVLRSTVARGAAEAFGSSAAAVSVSQRRRRHRRHRRHHRRQRVPPRGGPAAARTGSYLYGSGGGVAYHDPFSPRRGDSAPESPSTPWSQRMREKYGLDTSRFTYDENAPRSGGGGGGRGWAGGTGGGLGRGRGRGGAS